ncbi:hypothetical protein CA13_46720 [Planctomycetes bacterium CA13]|uniref:DUF4832 domain-containing protein n=1 Tax=Novipirellula herctigrandis TaxID=2527986 RepID=A0A5C5Z724_9BACT|nr:hypothetical protein CA13_46720 [Planctomycetes bacterium CA13]
MRFMIAAATVLCLGISSLWPTCQAEEGFAPLAYRPAPADNPLKGLVPYSRPAAGRFPHSMEFKYFPLSEFMIGENEFRWGTLESLLEEVSGRGKHAIVRVYLEYPGHENVIPKFLIDGGLKVERYLNTNTQPFPPKKIETPDYSDANLRKALGNFIAAFGKKYDGDPRLAYVTAGLLGTWGEWHTHPRYELWANKEVQTEVMQAYAIAFKKTPILLRYPMGENDERYAPTKSYPFGYHDDSFAYSTRVTEQTKHDYYFMAQLTRAKLTNVWKQHPIGGEIRPEVWGCVFDTPSCVPQDQSFELCVDETHATWLMDTGMFRKKASQDRYENAVKQVQRMGYEFHIESAKIDATKRAKTLVAIRIRNRGVAPFYRDDWQVNIGLIEKPGGKLVKHWSTTWKLTGILPSAEEPAFRNATIDLRNVPPGHYAVAISVPSNFNGGISLRFANQSQGIDRKPWATIGSLRID